MGRVMLLVVWFSFWGFCVGRVSFMLGLAVWLIIYPQINQSVIKIEQL